jgi:hypothetical protein
LASVKCPCPDQPLTNSRGGHGIILDDIVAQNPCILLIDVHPARMASEREKMLRGELFHAFVPDLVASRARCKHACERFNNAGEVPRRRLVELWRE